MLNIVTLLTTEHHVATSNEHGEAAFWRERGEEYVKKLFAGLLQWMPSDDWDFTLLTDAHRPWLSPFLRQVPIIGPGQGWWAKLNLFRPNLFTGKTLYLDLDNVVCGPLAPMVALEPDPLIMMNDRAEPGLPNGSTLLCYPERLLPLWEEYVLRSDWIHKAFREWPNASDQAYIADRVERMTRHRIPYFQSLLADRPGLILNSRVELEKGAAWDKASLVFGCGHPKPHESAHPFYAQHWRV